MREPWDMFAAGLSRPAADRPEGIDDRLRELLEQARAGCPGVNLADEVFLPYLAARLADGAPLATSLAAIRAPDLYLACACAAGDPAAIALLASRHLADLGAALAGTGLPAAAVDDVRQILRERLFVGERPRITAYAGRGDLGGWVRVAAARVAIDLLRKDRRELPVEDEQLVLAAGSAETGELADVELRAELARAFAESVAALSGRQRNLLRQHYLLDLSIDELAPMYRVHRATVARWIQAARDDLARDTRRRLAGRLRLAKADLESVLRLVDSKLDVSIQRFFATGQG